MNWLLLYLVYLNYTTCFNRLVIVKDSEFWTKLNTFLCMSLLKYLSFYQIYFSRWFLFRLKNESKTRDHGIKQKPYKTSLLQSYVWLLIKLCQSFGFWNSYTYVKYFSKRKMLTCHYNICASKTVEVTFHYQKQVKLFKKNMNIRLNVIFKISTSNTL